MTAGEYLTVTDLAARLGLAKGSVSERVSKLEAAGHVTTRREGRSKLVSVAEFEAAVGRTGDQQRSLAGQGNRQAPAPAVSDIPARAGYASEQERLTRAKADMAEDELARSRGELLRAADVTAAMEMLGEALVRLIEQLPSSADDLAAAVARDGEKGARLALKDIARRLREEAAREFAGIAFAPPAEGETVN